MLIEMNDNAAYAIAMFSFLGMPWIGIGLWGIGKGLAKRKGE